jgi:hypothetical protein
VLSKKTVRQRFLIESQDFTDPRLDLLLPFPTYQTDLVMQSRFWEWKKIIALANGWLSEAIGTIQSYFNLRGVALQ